MKEWKDTEHFFVARLKIYIPMKHLRDVCREITLAEHRAFRSTGRATSVLKDGDVFIKIYRNRIRVTRIGHQIAKMNDLGSGGKFR